MQLSDLSTADVAIPIVATPALPPPRVDPGTLVFSLDEPLDFNVTLDEKATLQWRLHGDSVTMRCIVTQASW